MKIVIKKCSNQDWVLHELQVAYQAETREVDTWKKAHDALVASRKLTRLTFQSEIDVVPKEGED